MRKIQTLCLIINTVDELFFPVIKRNLTTIEDFLRKNGLEVKGWRILLFFSKIGARVYIKNLRIR